LIIDTSFFNFSILKTYKIMAEVRGTFGKNGLGYSVEVFSPVAPKTVVKSWTVGSDDSQIVGGINDVLEEGVYNVRLKAIGSFGKLVVVITKWNPVLNTFSQFQRKRVVKAGRSTTYKNVVLDGFGWSFTNGFSVV
jgi:hypothetical protein